MTPSEVNTAKDLLWSDIQKFEPSVSRYELKTWGKLKISQTGLSTSLAQTEGAWFVRGIPYIHRAFSEIWGTPDLLVSMDCLLLWRPWWHNPHWLPRTEGLHLDQNPFSKPRKECVQGMVTLCGANSMVGGLQVVPKSHTDVSKAEFKSRYARFQRCGDWCVLRADDPMQENAQLLITDPGDLILWDSRTVHGGVVGDGRPDETAAAQVELARMAVTVAMTPRIRASEQVQAARVTGFLRGENFNHTPHEAGSSSGTVRGLVPKAFSPPKLNAHQRALLGGTLPRAFHAPANLDDPGHAS